MEILMWAILISIVGVLAYFNYYLNLAPGTDPEDFRVGPQQLNITCDCYLNTLILGGILVLGLSAGSSIFSSRLELYLVGGIAFGVVTLAGILGRHRRYVEWRELHKVIQRAVPRSHLMQGYRSPVEILFDDEENDEDEFEIDDY
ncbi:hypothetical protein EU527_02780 [Candidatus Thorarchaeota archaeon]|nr:MAG: hypothetical protein EU527_02780 [Candidatus Thorarchaeota archaeon]